jgi:phosphohistidine phosphatase
MKRLLLLRHAKAVPAEEPLADIARPLAPRGERDAQLIGGRLWQHHGRPDLILSSPATRAVQTARLIAPALEYPSGAMVLERRLYLAEPAKLVEVIAAQDAAVESMLVVGHNPGLTELVHELLPSFPVDDLPTAAVVAVDYTGIADWTEIGGGAARLAFYDYPKNPREPATAR